MNHNVHILLPQSEFFALKYLAKKEKNSVAEVIRRAIQKTYGTNAMKDKKAAFARLCQNSDLKMGDWREAKKALLHRYE